MEGSLHIGFDVVEIQKLNLGPNDTLFVTVKNDEMDDFSIQSLKKALDQLFPNNKVFVFGMRTCDDVKISVVNNEKVGYCNDCSCGKKEASEAENESSVNPLNSGE